MIGHRSQEFPLGKVEVGLSPLQVRAAQPLISNEAEL